MTEINSGAADDITPAQRQEARRAARLAFLESGQFQLIGHDGYGKTSELKLSGELRGVAARVLKLSVLHNLDYPGSHAELGDRGKDAFWERRASIDVGDQAFLREAGATLWQQTNAFAIGACANGDGENPNEAIQAPNNQALVDISQLVKDAAGKVNHERRAA